MRKITKIIFISSILSIIFSCDNFLDIVPKGKVKPETVEDYRGILTNAYNSIPEDKGYLALRSDEVKLDETDALINSTKNYFIWNDNDVEYQSDYNYRTYYNVIFSANEIINNATSISGKQSDISQLIGEAYLLRAYMHFCLVNLYSVDYSETNRNQKAIVIVEKSNIDNLPQRDSLGKVYDFILRDINKSFDYLNVTEQANDYKYRFSKLSAYAFKSRFFLYEQKWDSSIVYSQKVLSIKDTLQDMNVDKTTIPTNYKSVEAILSMETIVSTSLLNVIYVSDNLRTSYNINDNRLKNFYTGITSYNYSINKSQSDLYKTTFRTAEIYLNLAECNARLGNVDDAKKYLLKLLKYRLKTVLYNTEATRINAITSSDLVLTEIFNERAKELAFEGHRWFDLKRTTKPSITHSYKGVSYTLEQNDGQYVIPFPLDAKNNNPNLSN